MPKGQGIDLGLTAYAELFMDDTSREEAKLPRIYDIPLSEIDDFPDHPFQVRLDEDMDQLVESICANGIITPVTLRQKEDGRYEIIAGHRRKKACEIAGFTSITSIRNEVNRGVSYTRNRALCLAEGDYILFVDSDDWVSRDYASALWNHAKQIDDDALMLCGYHYIDHSCNTSSVVHGEGALHQLLEIPITDVFTLVEWTMLQQLWNKIFRRDVIEAHHIRFDESQSMGEDFQFVLDYMEAIQCKKCVVLNEPLYYYIRWNNSSLMSKFGPATRSMAIKRFERLRDLSAGENIHAQNQFQKAVDNLRQTYIYQTIRDRSLSKTEKRSVILELTNESSCDQIYRAQMLAMTKERVYTLLTRFASVPKRLKGRVLRCRAQSAQSKIKAKVSNRRFTVISQNCIGGVFYHDLGMQFLSPTIDLFFKEPDFVKFALNLEYYLGCDLQMHWDETYPVGTLDDITVYFMHYETCQEAKQAWERRAKRVDLDRVLVLSTDRNGFDDDVFRLWKQIPYPKVLFTANSQYARDDGVVFFPQYQDQDFVPDLIPERLFYKDDILIDTVNHLGGAAE